MPGAFAHMVAADRAKQAAELNGLDSIARSTLARLNILNGCRPAQSGPTTHICITFPLVAEAVKVAALNVYRDVESESIK